MLGLLVKSAAPPNFCTRFAKFMAVQPSALSSSMSERKQMFLRLAAPPGASSDDCRIRRTSGSQLRWSVAIGGNLIAVGAVQASGGVTFSGAAYVFTKEDSAWNQYRENW